MAERLRIIVSSSAAARRAAARSFLGNHGTGTELLLIGHSRGAAEDLAREAALDAGGSFGVRTATLAEYAASLGLPELLRAGLEPLGGPGLEAAVARAIFDADRAGSLEPFDVVRRTPGFVPAVASTLSDLRSNGFAPARLRALDGIGVPLADLLGAFESTLRDQRRADRTVVLQSALGVLETRGATRLPTVLLDPCLRSELEGAFVRALIAASPAALITIPAGDEETLRRLGPGCLPERLEDDRDAGSLGRVRRYVFSAESPPQASLDDSLSVFSAPGEARECVEISRLVLREARRGVRFDEMAVFPRSPALYEPILASAFRRADIPAYFAAGETRPDATGRAFLALLGCAAENLDREAFVEYLSLVFSSQRQTEPSPGDRGNSEEPGSLRPQESRAPSAEGAGCRVGSAVPMEADGGQGAEVACRRLRVLDDARLGPGIDRWRHGFADIEAEWSLGGESGSAVGADSPRRSDADGGVAEFLELRRFAEPVLGALADLPREANGKEWRECLLRLAAAALPRPGPVLEILGELAPMDAVGPLSLSEVRNALRSHLGTLTRDPPRHRYGSVFVGDPDEARGRQFAVVFVPGLAERMFPLADREDPLLPDGERTRLGDTLRVGSDRVRDERLRLRLVVGAATQRLYVSYPRLDVVQSRPRVPSFYPLELLRAATGRLPDVDAFEREAARLGGARLAWPAPSSPEEAIDGAEYDLARLGPLLRPNAPDGKGRMRYLLDLHPHLARSLRARWQRWELPRWVPADGPVRRTPEIERFLDARRLATGGYSVSALERYARCPYAFFLQSIHGFRSRRRRESIERVDPNTVAAMIEETRRRFVRAGRDSGLLPTRAETLPEALGELEALADLVSAEFYRRLAPRVSRVWEDEVESARASLRAWVRRLADDAQRWEIVDAAALGLPTDRGGSEPGSAAARRSRGFGAWVESRRDGADLRVTDYRSGPPPFAGGGRIQGGGCLGASVGALAVEASSGRRVSETRVVYRAEGGALVEFAFPFDEAARASVADALRIIDGGIAGGCFPPAPRDGACSGCEFAEVCGPYEEIRWQRKDRTLLRGLLALRGMR